MTDPSPAPHPPDANRDRDINLRAVLWFGGGLALTIIGVQLLLVWWFFTLYHREAAEKRSRFPLSAPEQAELPQTTFGSPVTGQFPQGPRLEGITPEGPRSATETASAKVAREEEELKGHGKPGAARLPIDVAMRLVVEERKPQGREPVRPEGGVPGTGGGSNSGRDLPEARR